MVTDYDTYTGAVLAHAASIGNAVECADCGAIEHCGLQHADTVDVADGRA